ncbi:LysR family transcriptional regulator [Halomonas beimenensis]|uniref:LysR family transcriptional regulator near succinyl-CoA:3-ketoacid-coenzyme A transferase n=1 Tax=Halomonas beimenensis TaxID=475662 RepID=A0A291P7N1_9GAMM|nr:LysR family transcriptional regulator [Halomonas beimenensis]ATJ82887.1 LysR family transcriptional regulator near succinyl-CoA:3-ketoacid-coenzyme A transferase [Halomonas beimenensis]
MTVKQLRAFLAVAQTLSFTQACERLHLSQPALSLTIKGLEESLGGRLLTRSTRSVRLTPEGESLVPLAKRLLADWDNTEELLRQRFTLRLGRVALAAMPSFAGNQLPAVLMAFRARYPHINVTVHDVINEQVIDMVRQGRVELGIAFEPEAAESLHFAPLFEDRFVAVVPAASPLADRPDIDWPTLLRADFITLQRPSMVRLLLEQQLQRQGIALPVAFESHQLATVGRMVAEGLGVSAVPSLCIDQMHELGARCLALHAPVIQRAVGVLSPGPGSLSVAAQALREVLQETITTPVLSSE